MIWDKFTKVQLQFWDIGGTLNIIIITFTSFKDDRAKNEIFLGQERFKNMTRVYYKDAGAAFIVFDVTRYI